MAVIIVRVSISTAANAADIYKYFTGNDEAVKKSASAAGDLVTEKSAVDANKAESKSETADENNEQQLLAVISEDSNLTDENEKNELSADANKETKKTNPIAVKGKDIRLLFWTDEKQIKEVSEEEDPSTDTENNLEENADDYSGADVNTGDYSGDIFYDEDEYVYYDDDYSDEWYYDDTDDYYYVPTLSDYLAMFTCSGCGRHCSLLSPGCGKGAQQASQYTQEYYSVYGA